MSCSINGTDVAASSTRWRVNDTATGGGAEAIALDWLSPAPVKMEQITVHWEAIPANSEDLTITIQSKNGSVYDTALRSVDPNSENIQDFVCVTPFVLDKDDRLLVDYANTDDQDVGVEVWLVNR